MASKNYIEFRQNFVNQGKPPFWTFVFDNSSTFLISNTTGKNENDNREQQYGSPQAKNQIRISMVENLIKMTHWEESMRTQTSII